MALTIWAPWGSAAWAPMVTGMIAGGAQAVANGGNVLMGMAFGAITGGVAMGGTGWESTLMSGLVGGTISTMMGGKFGYGFVAGSVGTMIGGQVGNPVGRVIASAALGGTITELTGGKFKNGAASAAFAAMIGEVGREFREGSQENGDGVEKIENIPDNPQDVFDEGYSAALKEQSLNLQDADITFHADKVQVAKCNDGVNCNSSIGKVLSVDEAKKFISENPGWYVSDGAYNTHTGKIDIYATATSSSILNYPEGTPQYNKGVLGLGKTYTDLSGVENVIQTLSHESGHRAGLLHGFKRERREFDSIKYYRRNR